MRLLLWAVIVFTLIMWLLHIKKTIIDRRNRDHANSQKAQDASEAMVRCAQCGIYIPASEAILIQSDIAFCSEEHRLKHSSR
jgi:uncharacterized protein